MAKHRATTVSPVKKIALSAVAYPIGFAQGFTQALIDSVKDKRRPEMVISNDGNVHVHSYQTQN